MTDWDKFLAEIDATNAETRRIQDRTIRLLSWIAAFTIAAALVNVAQIIWRWL